VVFESLKRVIGDTFNITLPTTWKPCGSRLMAAVTKAHRPIAHRQGESDRPGKILDEPA
jgi:hypothetical protein